MKGIIYKSHQRVFDCFVEERKEIISATAKGTLLKGSETIVVGDEVILEEIQNNEFQITSVLERRSAIYRQIKRENKKKLTAANVDLLVVLVSGAKPNYKRGLLDRFLLRSAQWDIPAIVVFNKMDAYNSKKFDINFEAERLKPLGVETFELSSKDLTYKNNYLQKDINDLRGLLKGKNSIFLGQSGVGKSTLISALSSGKVNLKTKAIGKAGKGAHTTTWSEIIDLGSFRLIDSPGIRSFSIDDLLGEDLRYLFPDMNELFTRCEFFDCQHEGNSKGCYFNSLDEGQEKDLILSRLDSYKKLLEELSVIPDWKKTT